MLIYALEGGATVVVRPSGTEPKMKLYLFARGKDRAQAQAVLERLRAGMEGNLK